MMRIFTCLIIAALCFSTQAQAQHIETNAKQALLLDMTSGMTLLAKDADTPMYPSSMTKLMTLYILMDRIKHGALTLEDTFPVSEKAWRKGGSKMFVEVGTDVSIADLLRGIIVQSGNDACIVVAEGISGSEEAFADEMNRVAKELELTNTHFVNSTGWPHPEHVMSARDLAILGQRLVEDFPDLYPMFAETEFTFSGIRQPNRNPLLGAGIGVDGLKTGHTEAAGYGIVISAEQENRRLMLVVNGLSSQRERGTESERLLRYGFREFEVQQLFDSGDVVETAEVWMGTADHVSLTMPHDVILSLPKLNKDNIRMAVRYDGPLQAPIEQGDAVATLQIDLPGLVSQQIPLLAGEAVHEKRGIARLWTALSYTVFGSQ